MLIAFTYLPGFVTLVFRGMPTVWRGRHRLIFCWLIFMQAVHPGRKTLAEMARWTPATITAWRFGRLLKAAYWNAHLLVGWLAQDLLTTLPPPTNGILYLFGDGSHADKRGAKNPMVQKGRISQHHPWFLGLRFVLLMAAWDGYRLPVGIRLILPKRHAGMVAGVHLAISAKVLRPGETACMKMSQQKMRRWRPRQTVGIPRKTMVTKPGR